MTQCKSLGSGSSTSPAPPTPEKESTEALGDLAKNEWEARDLAQWGEHLPGKPKAVSSIPGTGGEKMDGRHK